jgi:hypothetical protein
VVTAPAAFTTGSWQSAQVTPGSPRCSAWVPERSLRFRVYPWHPLQSRGVVPSDTDAAGACPFPWHPTFVQEPPPYCAPAASPVNRTSATPIEPSSQWPASVQASV